MIHQFTISVFNEIDDEEFLILKCSCDWYRLYPESKVSLTTIQNDCNDHILSLDPQTVEGGLSVSMESSKEAEAEYIHRMEQWRKRKEALKSSFRDLSAWVNDSPKPDAEA